MFLLTDSPIISLNPKELNDHPLNKKLFGDLPDNEYENLKKDIDNRGIQDPLHVVKRGAKWIVVSGHQRKNIAIDLKWKNVPCINRKDLKEDWQVEEQLIADNLLRRQLKDWQLAPIYLKRLEIEKEKAKQRQGERTDLTNAKFFAEVDKKPMRAVDKAADGLGKSGRQLEKIIKVYHEASKDIKKQWKEEKISTHAAYQQITGKDKGMSEHSRKTIFSSKSDDWQTPPEIYKKLNDEFNFDFDPCPLKSTFNGLEVPWKQRNFINPPYSNIDSFLEKAHKEIKKTNTKLHVFLIPVRTDTKWFHKYIYPYFKQKKDGLKIDIRFIKGRLKFRNGSKKKQSAPFPSMIVIFRRIE